MKKQVVFTFKLVLLWIVFFMVQRVLFYIHYSADFDVDLNILLYLPYHSLRIDVSSFCYLMGFPFIFVMFSVLNFSEKWDKICFTISKTLIWILAVLTSVLFSSELVSYYEWRAKLSSKIFIHFKTPSEVFRTSSGSSTWWFLLYFVIQIVVFYVLYKVLLSTKKDKIINRPNLINRLVYFFVFMFLGSSLFVLGLRGGWQQIPISATNAYYTNSQITNDLSVNTTWNFIHMTYEYYNTDYSVYYNNVPEAEAKVLVEELYTVEVNDSLRILKSDSPNLIFVTLESWSGQMVGSIGGLEDVTPNFNKLSKEGLLFTQIYATSETSETGHTSIFSGYPTLPKISMSTESAKCRQMPSMIKGLGGYSSAYQFGGALSYGNIGGYLREIGFESLKDENDLQHLYPKGDLGVHDEATLPYFYNEIKKSKRPYVYGLFTQSTHTPYDMDSPYLLEYPDNDFIKSLHYADMHIKRFTDSLKQLPDFDNTLVIFIADHGKTNFVNNDRYTDTYYHIPVLFWGGALKEDIRGLNNVKIGSQTDVVKTLLHQMNINTDDFNWSKDLLNPNTKEWAIITTSYTYGIKTPHGCIIYQFINDQVVFNTFKNQEEAERQLKNCRALIESVYREYVLL